MVLLSLSFLVSLLYPVDYQGRVGRFAFVIVGLTARLEIVFYVHNSRFKSENIDTQKNNISE